MMLSMLCKRARRVAAVGMKSPWHRVVALAMMVGGAVSGEALGQQPAPQELTLQQAIELAEKQSLPARAAASTREAARQRDRAFGANLLPQLSLTGNVPVYRRFITPVTQPDGTTLFRTQQLNQSTMSLRVDQRLPLTGGSIFVESNLQRLKQSGAQESLNWSSTPYSFGLRQEILRPNNIRWDLREQDLKIVAAERQYLEAREDVAIQTTNAFFDFYAARAALENAQNNAAVNDTLYTLNKGRYEVGKIGENDLLQSELALLRTRNSANGARLDYLRTLSALRVQLDLPADAPLGIVVSNAVPQVSADTTLAVGQALKNRPQMTEQELQTVQAKRAVNDARYSSGFGATVQASMGFNQFGTDVNDVYHDLLSAQQLSVSVSVPLVQWGARSARIQAARADEGRVDANRRLARAQLIQEALFAALQLDQSRSQLEIAAKADTVATKRFEVAKNRYVIGKIGMDNLYLAQNEKDQALQQYVQALRGYWVAYYRLRRSTLYDFVEGRPIR